MRTWTETHREGTNVGPVDWSHELAAAMPEAWRDAEKNPDHYRFESSGGGSFRVVALCMYDGWPYWEPRPALAYIGPLHSVEWAHFNSYGVGPRSLRKVEP